MDTVVPNTVASCEVLENWNGRTRSRSFSVVEREAEHATLKCGAKGPEGKTEAGAAWGPRVPYVLCSAQAICTWARSELPST